MAEPKYLREFAEYLAKVGESEFLRDYGFPALVGTTLIGELAPTKKEQRRTHGMRGSDEFIPMQSILDRVWLIRKSAQGENDKYVVIGQKSGCDIVVPEYTLSSRHAAFTADPLGTLKIADLGSLNGTKLNGEALPRRKVRTVADGSTVVMGRIGFQCYTRDGFMEQLRAFRLH